MRALRRSQGAKARVDRTGLLTLRKDVEIVVKGRRKRYRKAAEGRNLR